MQANRSTDTSSNDFLEKVLPFSALILTVAIVLLTDDRILYLGLCAFNIIVNVSLSKASKKSQLFSIEFLKLVFNSLFVTIVPFLLNEMSPIWALNILSAFRVPLVFNDRKMVYFGLFLLSAPILIPSLYFASSSSVAFFPFLILAVISLLSSATLFHLRYKSKKLALAETQNLNSARLAAVGQMAGGVAHEINTPLGVILLSSQMALKTLKNTDLQQVKVERLASQLETIRKTSEKIGKIISALRSISRDESSGEPLSKTTLTSLVKDLQLLCKEKALHKGITIDINCDPELSELPILLPKVQFSQILLNLFNNAFDAISENKTDTKKWVRLKIEKNEHILILKVSNSGEKISSELANKIFDPFFTTKQVGHGTGLGLSLSRSMIESNNGQIYLDEKELHTCFIIEFPLMREKLAV